MRSSKAISKNFNIPNKVASSKRGTKKPVKFHLSKKQREKLRKRKQEKMCFSLKYLELKHEAFNLGKTKRSWFISLLKVLRDISDLNRNELVVQMQQRFNCHNHDFQDTEYTYNFEEDFLEQADCRQFNISKSKGRVHGFIFGNTFFIVWLDAHHNLNPDSKFGGLTLYDPPMDEYEALYNEYEVLKGKNNKLQEELKAFEELLNKKANSESTCLICGSEESNIIKFEEESICEECISNMQEIN